MSYELSAFRFGLELISADKVFGSADINKRRSYIIIEMMTFIAAATVFRKAAAAAMLTRNSYDGPFAFIADSYGAVDGSPAKITPAGKQQIRS